MDDRLLGCNPWKTKCAENSKQENQSPRYNNCCKYNVEFIVLAQNMFCDQVIAS